MKRHPDLVHGKDVLGARDWTGYSTATKQVPDGQRTAKRRRLELVKDASNAERTSDRPTVTCGVTADDSVEIQEMTGYRLNRLR